MHDKAPQGFPPGQEPQKHMLRDAASGSCRHYHIGLL